MEKKRKERNDEICRLYGVSNLVGAFMCLFTYLKDEISSELRVCGDMNRKMSWKLTVFDVR